MADRGYESYNLMAHCQEKGWFYLISDSRWEKQYEAKFGSAFYGNLRRILYLEINPPTQ
ncbi:hypothetical protein K6969_10600 [Streptococcus suis]|nr:hypothetical protein K6969_10600 [Streptococcus suis]HEM6182873.1 hypothetical protein [Streptococcus suis]